jgi:hypothetical protein
LFLLLFVMFAFVFPLEAQTALEIAKKTIEASGGQVWRTPTTLQLEGTAIVYWFNEPKQLVKYKMWRVFPKENTSAHTANGKVRFDAFEKDNKIFFQISFDGEKTYQNLSLLAQEKQEFLRWGNNFGFSIFRFIENEGFKLELLPEDKVDGHPCYFIKVIDPSKTETIFGIDKKSFFIRYAGFKTPIGFHERIYDNFVKDRKTGFVQPLHLRIFNDGVKTTEVFWKTFKINEPIPDEVFTIKTL